MISAIEKSGREHDHCERANQRTHTRKRANTRTRHANLIRAVVKERVVEQRAKRGGELRLQAARGDVRGRHAPPRSFAPPRDVRHQRAPFLGLAGRVLIDEAALSAREKKVRERGRETRDETRRHTSQDCRARCSTASTR